MATTGTNSLSDRNFRRTRTRTKRLGVLLILLIGGFFVVSVTMLLIRRHEEWNDAVRSSQNLIRAQAQEIDRTLTSYDDQLRAAAAKLADPALRGMTPAVIRAAIFTRADARRSRPRPCARPRRRGAV